MDIPAILHQSGYMERMYQVLNDNDLSEGVVTSLDMIRRLQLSFFDMMDFMKSNEMSTKHRKEGNQAFSSGRDYEALVSYNKALLHAIKNSREMKLAYSNRSALLFKIEAYEECIKDINTCFKLDCPDDIAEKLLKREFEAKICLNMLKGKSLDELKPLAKKYFILQSQNSQIPCASADIDVIKDGEKCKIVAKNDIKVGTVVALEDAYVSLSEVDLKYVSCFYCNKLCFNLHPCKSCIIALFCSETCRKVCIEEYHKYECKVIHLLTSDTAVKAAFKFRNECGTWDKFIAASKSYGKKRIMESTVKQIFDPNNSNSILCISNDRHFIFGKMFSSSFEIAGIIDCLQNTTDFLPKYEKENREAIRAFGRVAMFFKLYEVRTLVSSSAERAEGSLSYGINRIGLYRFASKLKHSCYPNVIKVGLNKSIAIIAARPITSGTELTLLNGNLPDCLSDIPVILFLQNEVLCRCKQEDIHNKYVLTKRQLGYVEKVRALTRIKGALDVVPTVVFEALAELNDVPNSYEYKFVFKKFEELMYLLQCAKTGNKIIEAKI